MSERRYGFVGIVVDRSATKASGTKAASAGASDAAPSVDEAPAGPRIQAILSEFGHIIYGRMGLPHLEDDAISVITLILHATTDEFGALTGRLGRIPNVSVKSALAKMPWERETNDALR